MRVKKLLPKRITSGEALSAKAAGRRLCKLHHGERMMLCDELMKV